MSNKQRVLEALQSNPTGLTAAQLQARYGVGNARAEVSRLRMDGFAVYANRKTDTKGRTKTFYRLGRPSREIVAAGYRYMAMMR
jgi:predicted ArsR family transcriptional regulator